MKLMLKIAPHNSIHIILSVMGCSENGPNLLWLKWTVIIYTLTISGKQTVDFTNLYHKGFYPNEYRFQAGKMEEP